MRYCEDLHRQSKNVSRRGVRTRTKENVPPHVVHTSPSSQSQTNAAGLACASPPSLFLSSFSSSLLLSWGKENPRVLL